MVRSWAPAVLLIAGFALITSLYLPWQQATCGAFDYFQSGPPTAGLTNLSSGGCTSFDGWSTGIGAAAALFAVLSVAVGAAALARPNSFGAALGQCALSAGYFGLAIAVRAPLDARQESRVLHQPFHYAYGTYLGIAAAAVLLLFAWVTPLRDHVRFAPANLLAFVLAVGLLVAFLLPWAQFNRTTEPGLLLAPGLAGAALASLVPLVFWRPELPALGAAVALVTAGAVSYLVFPAARAYGAWLALGLAGALALLALIVGRPSSLHLPLRALPTLSLAVLPTEVVNAADRWPVAE